MTINIFVLKGDLNGKNVVVRFFFCRVYFRVQTNFMDNGNITNSSYAREMHLKQGIHLSIVTINLRLMASHP